MEEGSWGRKGVCVQYPGFAWPGGRFRSLRCGTQDKSGVAPAARLIRRRMRGSCCALAPCGPLQASQCSDKWFSAFFSD